jgi:hypothetical protein
MERINYLLDHPKSIQGDYLSSKFSHFVEGANFFVCSIRSEFTYPLFTFQKFKDTRWGMYAVSIVTLFWPQCLNSFFHAKSRFEKNEFARQFFNFNGLGQWSSPYALNCQRNSYVV